MSISVTMAGDAGQTAHRHSTSLAEARALGRLASPMIAAGMLNMGLAM